jgi:Cu-processing system permease protein
MGKIVKYLTLDLLRNWVMLVFTALLLLATLGFYALEGQNEKALIGLLNLSLLLVPMLTLVFSITYYYNMYDFILLILAQPIKRKKSLMSLYLSLLIVFSLSIGIGLGLPLLLLNPGSNSLLMLLCLLLLSAVFIAIALWVAVFTNDKSKGMGLSLLLWVYFVLLFDGILLLGMYNFADYPIEKYVLFFTFLNPVDLSRIMILMQTQTAALMGYSGAIFKQFFTTSEGISLAALILCSWVFIPLAFAFNKFKKKDL